jgi:hypothetical protein
MNPSRPFRLGYTYGVAVSFSPSEIEAMRQEKPEKDWG